MKFVIFLCVLLGLSGCAIKSPFELSSTQEITSDGSDEHKAYWEEKLKKEKMIAEEERKHAARPVPNLSKREMIVKSAMSYLGKRDGGDCSGFVNLVNIKNGSPFYDEKELSSSFDNARKSRAMYNLAKKKGNAFDQNKLPNIGDLVFFEDTERRPAVKASTTTSKSSNTKNKGKTKAKNEPKQEPKKHVQPAVTVAENITHVGIVTRVDADGTIEFIHHSNGKNILDYMNFTYAMLTKKDNKTVNTYMKRCPSKNGAPQTQCMNIAFFVAYGTF